MSDSGIVIGMYGICLDSDLKHFDYLIADNYDPRQEVPEGYETKQIPAGTWAVFTATVRCLRHSGT